jgi:hypothetical protein
MKIKTKTSTFKITRKFDVELLTALKAELQSIKYHKQQLSEKIQALNGVRIFA